MILDVGLIDGSGLALLDGDQPRPPTVLFAARDINLQCHDGLVAMLVKSQTTLDQLSGPIREQLEALQQSKGSMHMADHRLLGGCPEGSGRALTAPAVGR
jgi:hypothetical protein